MEKLYRGPGAEPGALSLRQPGWTMPPGAATDAELDENKELWILPDEETPASDKSFLDILQDLCHNDN